MNRVKEVIIVQLKEHRSSKAEPNTPSDSVRYCSGQFPDYPPTIDHTKFGNVLHESHGKRHAWAQDVAGSITPRFPCTQISGDFTTISCRTAIIVCVLVAKMAKVHYVVRGSEIPIPFFRPIRRT